VPVDATTDKEPTAMTTTDRSGPLAHLEVLDMSRIYPGAGDGMRAFAAPRTGKVVR
jgi:hypothetical protein